jgi:hypothetical protein
MLLCLSVDGADLTQSYLEDDREVDKAVIEMICLRVDPAQKPPSPSTFHHKHHRQSNLFLNYLRVLIKEMLFVSTGLSMLQVSSRKVCGHLHKILSYIRLVCLHHEPRQV